MLLKTDHLGIPQFTDKNLIDMIYSGHIEQCHVVLCDPSDDIERFNTAAEDHGLPTLTKYVPIDVDKEVFDTALQSEWFMPDEYKKIVLRDYLLERCKTEEEAARVCEEYTEYHKRNLLMLLRYMIYLVDFMRENNIIWGVGRGSSVSSYILYLIGIHRIDSIKYKLDYSEFFK